MAKDKEKKDAKDKKEKDNQKEKEKEKIKTRTKTSLNQKKLKRIKARIRRKIMTRRKTATRRSRRKKTTKRRTVKKEKIRGKNETLIRRNELQAVVALAVPREQRKASQLARIRRRKRPSQSAPAVALDLVVLPKEEPRKEKTKKIKVVADHAK